MTWVTKLLLPLLVSCNLGCSLTGSTTIRTVILNPNAPAGSTSKIIIAKINPTFWSSENVIISVDRNDKEIHYDVHHEDLSIMDASLGAVVGFALGSL